MEILPGPPLVESVLLTHTLNVFYLNLPLTVCDCSKKKMMLFVPLEVGIATPREIFNKN